MAEIEDAVDKDAVVNAFCCLRGKKHEWYVFTKRERPHQATVDPVDCPALRLTRLRQRQHLIFFSLRPPPFSHVMTISAH